MAELQTSKRNKQTWDLDRAFADLSKTLSRWTGSRQFFSLALLVLIVWLVAGPYYNFSEDWRYAIHTGVTACTFLLVSILQNSQNRDMLAVQIKLDEIIRAVSSAKNTMIDLEQLSHEELEDLRSQFSKLAKKARRKS